MEEPEKKIRSPMLGETRNYAVRPVVSTRRRRVQTPFRKYLLWGVEPEYLAATLGTASSWWRLSCRPGSLAWIGSLGALRRDKVATRYSELRWEHRERPRHYVHLLGPITISGFYDRKWGTRIYFTLLGVACVSPHVGILSLFPHYSHSISRQFQRMGDACLFYWFGRCLESTDASVSGLQSLSANITRGFILSITLHVHNLDITIPSLFVQPIEPLFTLPLWYMCLFTSART